MSNSDTNPSPSKDSETPQPFGSSQTRHLSIGLLLFAIIFNLYHLYPEAVSQAPMLNDGVLHLLALEETATSLAAGQNPTDSWLAGIGLGYPLFHHYQHLAYLGPALLHYLTGGILALPDLMRWTTYLLLSFFPLSIFWSMRRFGFSYLPAAMGGVLASLLATQGLFGLEFGSYLWRGSGLYTQLWGMFLLPPVLAQGYVTLRTGRGYVWTTLLLAATLLAHLVLGYIAVVSLGLVVISAIWERDTSSRNPFKATKNGPGGDLPAGQRAGLLAYDLVWQRGRRLALMVALVVLVIAYFLAPFLLDGAYMNRSVWETAGKYDSYGHEWVLQTLVRGDLFDFNRFPALTLLACLGFIYSLWRWRVERYRLPLMLALFWLLLYFGRSTWGPLLDILPMSHDLHFHRLIAGVHLGSIYLMGIGLALPWQWALARRNGTYLFAAAILTAALLFPVYQERGEYLAENARWQTESQAALAAEDQDVASLLATLHERPPGRVYAGRGNNWGRDYTIGAVPLYAFLNSTGLDTVGYLYHALSLNADIQLHFDDQRPEHYNLFNVRYIVSPLDRPWPEFAKPIETFGRHRLYEVETSGYFDWVETSVAFTGHKDDYYTAVATWLNSPLQAAKQHPALLFERGFGQHLTRLPLSQAGQILPQMLPPAELPSGRILSEAVGRGTYRAEVEATDEGTLMFKATYHPNWRAYVDGVEVKPMMVMPSYVGLPVGPGAHQIRLTYQPRPLRSSLLLLGLLVLILIAFAERRKITPSGSIKPLSLPLPVRKPFGWMWPDLKLRRVIVEDDQTSPLTRPSVGFKTLVGLYLLFFSIYLLSGAGHFFSTDHVAVYLTTQSLVEQHSLAIKPIADTFIGPDGLAYGVFGLGQSIISIPLYLVGMAVDQLSSPPLKAYWSGPNLGDWGGTVPIFFVSLLNQFVTPLSCILVFLFCRQLGFSSRRSFLVTLIFGFGTAAWVYAREYFQHPLESLFLLLSIYLLFANRDRLQARHALLSSLALAMGILTRINLLLIVPVMVVYLLYLVSKNKPHALAGSSRILANRDKAASFRGLRGDAPRTHLCFPKFWGAPDLIPSPVRYLGAFLLPIVVVIACLLYLNQVRYGHYLAFNPVAAAKGWSSPIWLGFYGHVFSPGRSIFLYSPPLLLAAFAYRRFYRQHRAEASLFLTIFLIYLIFYSTHGYWHGGWNWGPRFLLATVPLLMISAGYFLEDRRSMFFAALLACAGIALQLLGISVNYSYIHWDWQRMGYSLDNPDYLFLPDISPIVMHLSALLQQRHLDLWGLWVYQQFGLQVFLATIAVSILILGQALLLLKPLYLTELNRLIGPFRMLRMPAVLLTHSASPKLSGKEK